MNIQEHSTQINNATMYYHTAGDPQNRTLIFFHGWPGLYLLESGVIQELAKHFFVIAPEQPGLSRSEPLEQYSNILEQNAEVVHEIMTRERRNKTIILGQSFGGGVASAYAYQYPQETEALILVDSALGAGRRNWWANLIHGYGHKVLKLLPHLPRPLKKLILKYVFATPVTSEETWKSITRTMGRRLAMVENWNSILQKSRDDERMVIDRDYADFPIIIVWGDQDGKEFNLYGSIHIDDARWLYEKMKDEGRKVSFVPVHGGHTVLYTQPQYVVSEIMKQLSKVL